MVHVTMLFSTFTFSVYLLQWVIEANSECLYWTYLYCHQWKEMSVTIVQMQAQFCTSKFSLASTHFLKARAKFYTLPRFLHGLYFWLVLFTQFDTFLHVLECLDSTYYSPRQFSCITNISIVVSAVLHDKILYLGTLSDFYFGIKVPCSGYSFLQRLLMWN